MKKNDLVQLPDVKSVNLNNIFTAPDASSNQILDSGTYKFHNKVKEITSNNGIKWQAAILIGDNEVAIPVSPRTLCGLAFVGKKLTKVNEKSLKGDLLKLIEAESVIEISGFTPEIQVDRFGTENETVGRRFPIITLATSAKAKK